MKLLATRFSHFDRRYVKLPLEVIAPIGDGDAGGYVFVTKDAAGEGLLFAMVVFDVFIDVRTHEVVELRHRPFPLQQLPQAPEGLQVSS